jgi:hypothetical protein
MHDVHVAERQDAGCLQIDQPGTRMIKPGEILARHLLTQVAPSRGRVLRRDPVELADLYAPRIESTSGELASVSIVTATSGCVRNARSDAPDGGRVAPQ